MMKEGSLGSPLLGWQYYLSASYAARGAPLELVEPGDGSEAAVVVLVQVAEVALFAGVEVIHVLEVFVAHIPAQRMLLGQLIEGVAFQPVLLAGQIRVVIALAGVGFAAAIGEAVIEPELEIPVKRLLLGEPGARGW